MKNKEIVAGVDKPVSQLALGTVSYSLANKERSFSLLDDFVTAGGTAIDTARCYGESEDVIGLWMESRANRERIFLITKGGLSRHDSCRLAVEGIEEKIESDLTESLQRLRTDYVDLYFLHRDTEEIPVARMVDCLNKELRRGRIRAFGGSNWEPRRVDEANEYAAKRGLTGFAAVSNNLSLAVPTEPYYRGLVSVDEAGRRWHARTGIPLFSWSSQARGFFSGRFRPDVRTNADMVRVYYTEGNFERLRRATMLGQRKGGYSATQVALAYLLHLRLPLVPIVGPLIEDELASCLGALQIKLTHPEVQWLNLEAREIVSPVAVSVAPDLPTVAQ